MAIRIKDGTPKSVTARPSGVAKATKAKKPESVQGRAKGQTYDNVPMGPGMGTIGTLFTINMLGLEADGIVPWSWYPLYRDRQLRMLYRKESIMAGAVYSLQARIRALPWTITAKPRAKTYFQNVLGDADEGNGWLSFVGKLTIDLLTQDNGAFIELVGAGNPDSPMRGPVIQMNQLDAGLSWRTHDPEFPVIYTNPYTGQFHALHKTRVIRMASMEQPQELARGIGFCGVSRVQRSIQTAKAIETFKDEKISGRFRRGIIFGHGFTAKQMRQAEREAAEAEDTEGLVSFNHILTMLSMQPDAKLEMLDLASLPDGFDYKEDLLNYVYMVALAFGTDAREFWGATSSGATKADAEQQHVKSQGKGIADLVQTFEHAFNWGPLRDVAELTFDKRDLGEQLEIAQLEQVEATTINVMEQAGNITAQEGRAILIAKEIIDVDVLASVDNPVAATDAAPLIDDATSLTDQAQQADAAANQANRKVDNSAMATPDPTTNLMAKELTLARGRREHKHAHGVKADGKKKLDPRVADLIDRANNYRDDLGAIFDQYMDDLRTMPDQQAAAELRRQYISAMEGDLSNAYAIGLGGDPVPDKAEINLREIARQSLDFFDGSFLPDLSDAAQFFFADAEDIIPQPSDVFRGRLMGYAGAWWQSMWQGAADAWDNPDYETEVDGELLPPRVERKLDAKADHCETCPDKEGIYESWDDMESEAGVPGDGSDDCYGNCRCTIWVESAYGAGDFAPPDGVVTRIVGALFSLD